MNVYTTDRIRNVVLLGHGGCGKTSLVEAMAYLAGMTSRMGKVEDGNTISDYDKEEMKRHFSINTLREMLAGRVYPKVIFLILMKEPSCTLSEGYTVFCSSPVPGRGKYAP